MANDAVKLGWQTELPHTGAYVCPLSFEYSLIKSWMEAGFHHYSQGHSGPVPERVDFAILRYFPDTRIANPMVVVPTHEGARLWLQMNAPS